MKDQNEIDLVENGKDEAEARLNMGKALVEYAQEYYENYSLYSNAHTVPARVPYISCSRVRREGLLFLLLRFLTLTMPRFEDGHSW